MGSEGIDPFVQTSRFIFGQRFYRPPTRTPPIYSILNWWAEKDSNLRTPKRSGLQPDAFGQTLPPTHYFISSFSFFKLVAPEEVESPSPLQTADPQPAAFTSFTMKPLWSAERDLNPRYGDLQSPALDQTQPSAQFYMLFSTILINSKLL